MKTKRYFLPVDRYYFDFKRCAHSKGFAQIDTGQDASYFGTWCNPWSLTVVSYLEGDVIIKKTSKAQEFVDEINEINKWNIEQGYKPIGIDEYDKNRQARYQILGLGSLLH